MECTDFASDVPMASRALWKGNIKLGPVTVPVKLYSAVTDATVHFHLLHRPDSARVKQRMVNPATGEAVEHDHVQRGFEVEPGKFVLLDEKELAKLEPPASRDIEVRACVPRLAIDPAWYERPYYLGPDSSTEPYFALVEALTRRERVGIVRWVMRDKQYYGALRPEGDHLIVVTLRTLDEIVRAPKIEPASRAADARELGMAVQLVSALEGTFDPDDFRDEHRDRVLELVQAKAHGKKLRTKAEAPRRSSRSLTAALSASLKQVQKERKSA